MIGVIDSGLGGLAIAREIWRQQPETAMVYLADHAYFPYGNKNKIEITKRLAKIIDWLINKNCRLVVIACNTITAAAIDQMRRQFTVPIVGTEPAVKQGGVVLATPTTAQSRRYRQLAAKYPVMTISCPNLAPAIEKGELIEPHLPPLPAGTKKVVLGCTHYILVKDQIQKHYGDKISLVDPSRAVARQALSKLIKVGFGPRKFFTTGDEKKATKRASFLLRQRIIFSRCSL